MSSVRNAIVAGFVATFITSGILLMKNAIGLFQEVHIPQTLSNILGMPDHIVAGGIAFFLIGTVILGAAYALIAPRIPVRSNLIKGLLFGLGVWLAMMLVLMPVAGAGMFALHRSAIVPAVDLVLTLIYGLILAVVYAYYSAESSPTAQRTSH